MPSPDWTLRSPHLSGDDELQSVLMEITPPRYHPGRIIAAIIVMTVIALAAIILPLVSDAWTSPSDTGASSSLFTDRPGGSSSDTSTDFSS